MQQELRGRLVRDKIPDIIRASGELPILGEWTHPKQRFCDKLLEETLELLEARGSRPDILDECADVKEVLDELFRERRVRMPHLILEPVCGNNDDLRKELYDSARLVRRSVGAIGCLEDFLSIFRRTLVGLHIHGPELQYKQNNKRREKGGFKNHIILLNTLCVESVLQFA